MAALAGTRSTFEHSLRVAVLCACLAACKVAPQRPPEYLDPLTAAMVSSVSTPITFARAHQDVSVNSRQDARLVGASVNRSGRFEYFLLVYVWSTIDPRLGAGVHGGDTLVLLADDRAIRLQQDGRSLKDAGIGTAPGAPLHVRAAPGVYRTDAATLQFVSSARRLRLQFEGDRDTRPFEIWKDGRRELGQLAAAPN